MSKFWKSFNETMSSMGEEIESMKSECSTITTRTASVAAIKEQRRYECARDFMAALLLTTETEFGIGRTVTDAVKLADKLLAELEKEG